MKTHPILTVLTIVILFPAIGVFAQEKANPNAKGVIVDVPETEHINAFRADNIIGSKVINLEGQDVGTIDDLVVDIDTGDIVYAALEFGGFMGFGDKLFAVPWHSLTAVPAEGIFIIDQSKAKLEKAPGFDKRDWPDIGDQNWRAGIYEFYRHHIPSPQASTAPETPLKQEMHHGYRRYAGYPGTYYTGIWQDPFGKIFNPKTMDTVTGEILKLEYDEGVRLILYNEAKKPVLVAIGPIGYLEGQRKVLKSGDHVTVTGSKVIVDDTPYLIATEIKEGNEVLQLRDKEGNPVWMGWKNIK